MQHAFKHRDRIAIPALGSVLQHQIPLGGYVFTHFVIVGGQVVISAGTANGTSLGENPYNLFLSRLTVEASSIGRYPGGVLKRLYPRSMVRRRIFDRGRSYLDTALTGAAGTFTINSLFELQWSMPSLSNAGRSPASSPLKTDEYVGLQLRLETGTVANQFTGNDRTFNVSANFFDILDKREDMQGDVFVILEDDLIQPIAVANPAFSISQLPARGDYLDVLICAETTNQQLADTIVNRAAFINGSDNIFDQYAVTELKASQALWIEQNTTGEPTTGLYFCPIDPDRLLGGAVPVMGANQLVLLMDVSAPGAGADRLIISSRRCLDPRNFLPNQR